MNELSWLVFNNPLGPKKVLSYRKAPLAHEESNTCPTGHLPLLCSVAAHIDSRPRKPPTIYLLREIEMGLESWLGS